MIKAVVFDMDGVLVDATEMHRSAFEQALPPNLRAKAVQDREALEGRPTKVKLQMLGLSGQEAIEAANRKQEITLALAQSLRQDNRAIKAVKAALDCAGSVGVCTNSIRRTTEAMLRATGVWPYIDAIVTNEDVDAPKPDPSGYSFCFACLLVDPSEVLVIEDTDLGFSAAVAAGAHVVKVAAIEDVTDTNVRKWVSLLNG